MIGVTGGDGLLGSLEGLDIKDDDSSSLITSSLSISSEGDG